MESQVEKILAGSEEAPSLLHGDLWSGNFLMDEKGNPCLIDPAASYGHREADLSMTSLFGGFPREFYHSYREAYPIKNPANYENRIRLYQLYHILNHLNLFGGHYLQQAENLLQSILRL